MEEKILIIESDLLLAGLYAEWLAKEDYHTQVATNTRQGLQEFHAYRPSLVLVGMNGDGLDVLRHVKEAFEIPVIVVASSPSTADTLKAFDMGADDYLMKPVERLVLLARMRAVLRRYPKRGAVDSPNFQWDGLEVDFPRYRVSLNGRELNLSPTEFRLLSCLVKNAGRVVGHRQLLLNVWGPNYLNGKEYLKLYVRYLRLKLGEDPQQPKYIKTVRGIGYCFEGPRAKLFAAGSA